MHDRAEWVSTDGRETIDDDQLWRAVAQGVARVVESSATAVTIHWVDDARTAAYRYLLAGGPAEAATNPNWPVDERTAREAAGDAERWETWRCAVCGYYPPCQCPGNPFGTRP